MTTLLSVLALLLGNANKARLIVTRRSVSVAEKIGCQNGYQQSGQNKHVAQLPQTVCLFTCLQRILPELDALNTTRLHNKPPRCPLLHKAEWTAALHKHA